MELFAMQVRRLMFVLGLSSLSLIGMQDSVWAQRELKDIPPPDPVKELAAMALDPNLEVNLYASDPAIAKPIHMNFDEKGRLWVATSEVYPQIEPGEVANDKIVVLEDADGDGVAEKQSVFADGLLIPTGVLPGDGGVYVANSTELIHLTDSDGDGKADRQRTVLSGFGTEDTHHLLHTLRWGPDGRMYLNQSIYIHSHVETPFGVKRLDGGGAWRFDTATQELEVFMRGLVNPWGHVFDDWGQSFMTDGAGGDGINYTFPESVFMTSPGATRWLIGLNPGSPKHCGLEIISGEHFPEEYRGRFVTNDFRSHRVCLFDVTRTSASYVSKQLPEVIRSEHIAFRPVDVKMGPDGALYIADWYNPIIQHGEVDFRDPRRDRKHGRIWRVSAKGRPALKTKAYAEASVEELVSWLDSKEEWVKQWTRLELMKRPADRVLGFTQVWLEKSEGASQRSHRLLESAWIAECIKRFQPEWIDELRKHSEPRLRAIAIRILSRNTDKVPNHLEWLREGIRDADWQVRLEAICALDRIGSAEAVSIASNAADQPMNAFVDFALWSTLRRHANKWIERLDDPALADMNQGGHLVFAASAVESGAIVDRLLKNVVSGRIADADLLAATRTIGSRTDAKGLGALLRWLIDAKGVDKGQILEASLSANIPENAESLVKELLASDAGENRTAFESTIARAIGLWKIDGLRGQLELWAESEDPTANVRALASIMSLANWNDDRSRDVIRRVVTNSKLPSSSKAAAIVAYQTFNPEEAAVLAVDALAEQKSPPFDATPLQAILQRKDGPVFLAKSLARDVVLVPDAAREAIRVARATAGTPDGIIERLQALGSLSQATWKFSPELSLKLQKAAAEHGDPVAGEKIYRQAELQCTRCHAIGPAGGAIGPNLLSLGGSSTPDYIIESLLAPDARMKEGFQSMQVQLDDGTVLTGLQRSKTEEQLELMLATGEIVKVPLSSIEETKEGKSIMPSGAVDRLTEKELVDLIRFLSELGKTPAYTVSTNQLVRNWQYLEYTDAGHTLLNRTSLDSAATMNPSLSWKEAITYVNGKLDCSELPAMQPHRQVPPLALVRFPLQVQTAGKTILKLSDAGETLLWVDGRPVPAKSELELEFAEGIHWIVLGINKQSGPKWYQAELASAKEQNAVIQLIPFSQALAK